MAWPKSPVDNDHSASEGGRLLAKARLISICGNIPWLGPSLRKIARRYPEGAVTTIKSGHLAGCRWKRSHRYVNGYWLGVYELPIQECLARELKPGDVFYDIGANAGFFTLLGSKCVRPEGRVFSFEPLPENISSIRSQLELNDAANCTIVEAAVADRDDMAKFCDSRSTSTAHLQGTRNEEDGTAVFSVRAIALDSFSRESPAPDFIKMDIEGAELLALQGARQLLSGDHAPRILIEFHSESLKSDGCSMLREFGYRFSSIEGSPADGVPKDYHVLCIPPQRKA